MNYLAAGNKMEYTYLNDIIKVLVSLAMLLHLNCALFFPSLFNLNIQEDIYCPEAKDKIRKCNQMEGQERSTCMEEANRLQEECIEAIQKERNSLHNTRIIENKMPLGERD